MREKIEKFRGRPCKGCKYAPYSQDCYPAFPTGFFCKGDIDDLFSLLKEEIKKVENPYSKYAAGDEHEVGFEACRLNIIKKMEEK